MFFTFINHIDNSDVNVTSRLKVAVFSQDKYLMCAPGVGESVGLAEG